LGTVGYKHESAYNGQQAIDLIEGKKRCSDNCRIYRLILMDCNMPRMSGKECSERIRKHENSCARHCQPYIIAQTGYVTGEFRLECSKAGMSDYLAKPIQLDQLSEALKRSYQYKLDQHKKQDQLKDPEKSKEPEEETREERHKNNKLSQ